MNVIQDHESAGQVYYLDGEKRKIKVKDKLTAISSSGLKCESLSIDEHHFFFYSLPAV